jgi:hypothetical protein
MPKKPPGASNNIFYGRSYMKTINGREYVQFLTEIKSRIIMARELSRRDDKELIKLYRDIARSIIEQQGKYKRGDALVEKLTDDLKEDFKKTFGFSAPNLWSMCQPYECLSGLKINKL